MTATLAIDQALTPRWRAALEHVRGLTLLSDAPTSALLTADAVLPLDLRRLSGSDLRCLDEIAAERDRALLVLIDGVLDDQAALRLEDRGVAFADAAGRAWVPGTPRSAPIQPRRGRTRPALIRAAQILADHPDDQWTERKLSSRAAISVGTAHKLLVQLAELRLVARSGLGAGAQAAAVNDAGALRRWLIGNAGRDHSPRVSFYVRDPANMPTELDGTPLVRSGAEGARLLGLAVMSSVARVLIRMPVTADDLADIPARLRGTRTARGANVLLVADVDRLAAVDARQVDGDLWVAPPSRVAVDLGLEPRGAAARAVFLDLWGDTTI